MSSPALKAPSPDAPLVELDERQLGVLRRVGREWGQVCGNPEVWRRALPVDPSAGNHTMLFDIVNRGIENIVVPILCCGEILLAV